jgi:phospholipid-binding lipoprotein MlaA
MIRWARTLAVLMLLSLAAGCASTGSPSAEDPLEGFNRSMHSFNEGFDNTIGKPVATAYRDVVPGPMRYWVRNFFSNIADLFIGVNNLIQGKPLDALTDWTRFAMNSTMGLFGVLDFASEVGIEKHDEDFGQTFGRWGVGNGDYIVWPMLGSSTMRDSVGLIFDYATDPVAHHKPIAARNLMAVTRVTSKRADLLDASRILEEAALDKYVFQRDAYLQRRRSLIHDGNPPRAERAVPRAEASDEPVRAPAPTSRAPVLPLPAQASVEAAVEMLEAPAGALRSGG